MRLLLVEDDPGLGPRLQSALNRAGYATDLSIEGKDAEAMGDIEPYDLIVLDLGLPGRSGLEVLTHWRQRDNRTPVIILTARDGWQDKVEGFRAGADDYLAKPFETDELLARLRVFERRLSSFKHAGMAIGPVMLDSKAQLVTVDGHAIDLSRREFMLLKILMENAGRVQTRDSLESKLYRWGEEIASNAIEVHIHHLRKKLPEQFIRTVRGVGYSIKPV